MKKLILLALVLIISSVVAFSTNANSFERQNVFIDGEKLKLIEVPEFTSVGEDIKNLANTYIYQLVDAKEFDEFVQSPNRLPYASVLGVETEQLNKLKENNKVNDITIHFIKTSPPLVQPNVWHVDVPVEGYNLPPSYGNPYGTYSGYIYVSVSLTWSPSNVPIDVGIQYTDSSYITAHRLTGGYGSTGFNVDPSKPFNIWIINPSSNSVNINHYQGTLSLWAQ